MSFQNHIKRVAPKLSQIKSRQPAMLLGNKVIVAGIGGNFIPGAQSSSDSTSATVAGISAGYITISDSVITVHNVTDGTTSTTDKLYIADTGVEEPAYEGGGGGASMDFYKCASVDTSDGTWTGYKLVPNADNGYSLANTATSVGEYYVMPTVDKIYDPTGKLELKSFYPGDNHDPYGDGLLYSIFIDGGEAWSAPTEDIATTDNYTSNVETVDGITARKFNGNEAVTTTKGTQRTLYSASVWIKATGSNNMYAIGGYSGIVRIRFQNSGQYVQISRGGTVDSNFWTNDNRWHHYVVTSDGTSWKVYYDNTLKNTYSSVSSFSNTGLIFGKDGDIEAFTGYIANFRYYDHALTSSEIAALYAELTPTSN